MPDVRLSFPLHGNELSPVRKANSEDVNYMTILHSQPLPEKRKEDMTPPDLSKMEKMVSLLTLSSNYFIKIKMANFYMVYHREENNLHFH